MATFTSLTDGDLAALAERFGLGAVRAWRPIAAGTINSNFDVEAAEGRFFVRVNEGKAEADVAWEAALVLDLAAAGVATPAPRRTRDGVAYARHRDHLVSVFPWVDGGHLAPEAIRYEDTHAVGRALARLHLAGATIPVERHRASIYAYPRIKERFTGFAASDDPALAPAIAAIAEEIAWLDARAADRAALPGGIIHGDLFRDNVLFDGGRVVALIDFEQASAGTFLYDLAVTVNDWCWIDGAFEPIRVASMVAGYAEVRALSEVEHAMFHVEARAAAMRFTVTRITDVHLAGVDKPDKDFREYLARLEALRLP